MRDVSDKEAILQAIRELEVETIASSGATKGGKNANVQKTKEMVDGSSLKAKDSPRTVQSSGPSRDSSFLEALSVLKDANACHDSHDAAADMDSPRTADGAEPYQPTTSEQIRQVLDRAALSMAENEIKKSMKGKRPSQFEESEDTETPELEVTEADRDEFEPVGGPLSYKLKVDYVDSWLSTDDNNLEDLLERRNSGMIANPEGG